MFKSGLRKIGAGLALLLLILIIILLVNMIRASSSGEFAPSSAAQNQNLPAVDRDAVAANLAKAISFKTISTQPENPDFAEFRAWLSTAYPLTHAAFEKQILGGGTLLFKWPGSNAAAAPVLLTGHYDVVPVSPDTKDQWKYDPFGSHIAENYIWGRGALDNKSAVIAIMEAAENMLKAGFQPRQTLYFSFGHDEEIGGRAGAASVVQYFKDNDIELAWSLDEGSYAFVGMFPGIAGPVASINVAEKGFLTLKITAKGAGGHSSMPPAQTAVGLLAKAVTKIEENPLPGKIDGLTKDMFDGLAPHFEPAQRLMFANQWLFGDFLEGELSRSPATNAMLRTTTAPTMLSGSPKENILPTTATAMVNFRIHPRDTVEYVQNHVSDLVSTENITVEQAGMWSNEPSKISSHESTGYQLIAQSFVDIYGKIIIVPGLTVAGTDSSHYAKVAKDAYRINPFLISQDDLNRFHGLNERISIENMEKGVAYFQTIIGKL